MDNFLEMIGGVVISLVIAIIIGALMSFAIVGVLSMVDEDEPADKCVKMRPLYPTLDENYFNNDIEYFKFAVVPCKSLTNQ